MVKRTYRGPPSRAGTKWHCSCGKTGYSTWAYAAWDARQMRLRYSRRRREQPYWSRDCHCYHCGSKPKRNP